MSLVEKLVIWLEKWGLGRVTKWCGDSMRKRWGEFGMTEIARVTHRYCRSIPGSGYDIGIHTCPIILVFAYTFVIKLILRAAVQKTRFRGFAPLPGMRCTQSPPQARVVREDMPTSTDECAQKKMLVLQVRKNLKREFGGKQLENI